MPAAVVASIIGAAGGIGAAAIQSRQVGKAVGAQRDATNQAIQNLEPFRKTGTEAFQTLGALMGLGGGGAGGGAPAALGTDAPISPGQANFAGYSPNGGYIGKNVPMGERMSNPNVNVDAAGYTAQQHGASMPTASSYGGNQPFGSQTGGGMIQMRAPTGEVQSVPVDQVAHYQQQGATVIGRA